MNIKLKYFLLLILCIGTFSITKAQPKKVDAEMAKFFTGNWTGEGQFANGKKIAADPDRQNPAGRVEAGQMADAERGGN